MQKNLPFIGIVVLLILIVLVMSAYTVDQRQAAIKFRLGEVRAIQKEPGLYFKLPMIENIRVYDTRIQTLDTKDSERIQTKEKNNVLVDSYVKYRIVDFQQFYVSTGGDLTRAELRLSQSVNDDLRAEFGQRSLAEVISGERDKFMGNLRVKTDKDARSIGIEVVDVRLKRVDLVPEISAAVYQRMDSGPRRHLNFVAGRDAQFAMRFLHREKRELIAEVIRTGRQHCRLRLNQQRRLPTVLLGGLARRQMRQVLAQRHRRGILVSRGVSDLVEHGCATGPPCPCNSSTGSPV